MVALDHARTYRTNSVLTASPGQLVLMLYDGALKAMRLAREGFAQPESDPRRLEGINTNLLKAQAIIGELQDTLDHQAGGEFAATMHRLYDYYNRRLLEANIRKDPRIGFTQRRPQRGQGRVRGGGPFPNTQGGNANLRRSTLMRKTDPEKIAKISEG
jgi:flagellar protein FliS